MTDPLHRLPSLEGALDQEYRDPRRQGLGVTLFRLVLFPLVYALPFALFFGTLFGANRSAYLTSYAMSLVFAYCIGTAIWAVQRFAIPPRDCVPQMNHAHRMLQIALWIVGASLVSSYLAALIIHFTIFPRFLGSLRAVAISGMFTLIFTALIGGIHFAVMYYRQAVMRGRAVELARAELARAELRALRAQINPHFLFNTLNSIAALIVENPRAAEDVTTRLADVFRYSLTSSGEEQARLGDELEFLRNYLAIERTRFGDRLKVEESIEPGLESIPVPSLLLQPLVENAVHHGISKRPEGGTVRLRARRDGDRLVLEVEDDGPGMNGDAPPSGVGFGLHSVRERLRVAAVPGSLEVHSSPGAGTLVRVWLPLSPDAAERPAPSKGTAA